MRFLVKSLLSFSFLFIGPFSLQNVSSQNLELSPYGGNSYPNFGTAKGDYNKYKEDLQKHYGAAFQQKGIPAVSGDPTIQIPAPPRGPIGCGIKNPKCSIPNGQLRLDLNDGHLFVPRTSLTDQNTIAFIAEFERGGLIVSPDTPTACGILNIQCAKTSQ